MPVIVGDIVKARGSNPKKHKKVLKNKASLRTQNMPHIKENSDPGSSHQRTDLLPDQVVPVLEVEVLVPLVV